MRSVRSIEWLALICVVVVMWLVASDPYSWWASGSDSSFPAPLWQKAIAVVELLALASTALALLRGRNDIAAALLLVETIIAIAAAVGFVQRDGLSRFLYGIGSRENLSPFLMSIALRVAALFVALWYSARRTSAAA